MLSGVLFNDINAVSATSFRLISLFEDTSDRLTEQAGTLKRFMLSGASILSTNWIALLGRFLFKGQGGWVSVMPEASSGQSQSSQAIASGGSCGGNDGRR